MVYRRSRFDRLLHVGSAGTPEKPEKHKFYFWFRYLESCLHIKTITTKLGQIKSETGQRGGQLVWGSLFIRSRYNTENSRIYIQPEFFFINFRCWNFTILWSLQLSCPQLCFLMWQRKQQPGETMRTNIFLCPWMSLIETMWYAHNFYFLRLIWSLYESLFNLV